MRNLKGQLNSVLKVQKEVLATLLDPENTCIMLLYLSSRGSDFYLDNENQSRLLRTQDFVLQNLS